MGKSSIPVSHKLQWGNSWQQKAEMVMLPWTCACELQLSVAWQAGNVCYKNSGSRSWVLTLRLGSVSRCAQCQQVILFVIGVTLLCVICKTEQWESSACTPTTDRNTRMTSEAKLKDTWKSYSSIISLKSNLGLPSQSHKNHLLQIYSDKHHLLFISSALLIKTYINLSVILS